MLLDKIVFMGFFFPPLLKGIIFINYGAHFLESLSGIFNFTKLERCFPVTPRIIFSDVAFQFLTFALR